jgi:hypothetical protein
VKLHYLTGLLITVSAASQGFQINGIAVSISVSTTATQAILQYASPLEPACTLKVADLNRRIAVADGRQSSGLATITTRSPHGLAPGAMVYLDELGVAGWNGWQTVIAVTDAKHFTFTSSVAGNSTAGNVGVLVDDVNPNLFPEADRDSRPGNPNNGQRRVFVVGKRTAEVAADGNRYTRALQVNSRHHYTLTCGTQDFDQEFTTQNLPLGDTHNDGPPVDRGRPGQYAYPTVQWANQAQSLIDPSTGLRSTRSTGPVGTASAVQSFQTAIDKDGAWKTASGPLNTGGTATFTGPCQSGNCALFLRADNLLLPGGATYNSGYGVGSSLDWIAVTISNASVSNDSCAPPSRMLRNLRRPAMTADACDIVLCLTVNGVTCASAERGVALTNTPTSYTVGSKSAVDLWQDSGAPAIARPDVSKATGSVNYISATRRVTWAGGQKFSVKWTPGSRIMVAGSEYQVESIQSETSLTLAAPGPVGDLQQVPYSANNFGVLIRMRTPAADQVTIGQTTFQYGSSAMPAWPAASVRTCSPTAVTAGGVAGYNCFTDRELYWISSDGSDVRDIGYVALSGRRDAQGVLLWSAQGVCGQNGLPQFDPLDGDTWYCQVAFYPFSDPRQAIVKAHYEGAHAAYTPGAALPDCDLNGGVQPCIRFTPMQPNKADSISVAGPAFNPDYQASGYAAAYWVWGGVSLDGEILVYTRESGGQDTKGWIFVFTLGDRTPAGTGPNSIRPIAAASSYRRAPGSWCTIHSDGPPEDGWEFLGHNDFSYKSGNYVYRMTLTSAPLNTSTGVPGGLNTCPSNPFGVTGQNCTDIVTAGEPVNVGDGSHLQDTQVGDVIRVDNEFMRVLVKTDPNHLTVQRGYSGVLASHSGASLPMSCGLVNKIWGPQGVWNFRSDPYGANTNWDTILTDWNNVGGHGASGGGVHVQSVGMPHRIGEAACPAALLGGSGANCYQVRRGTLNGILSQPSFGVALNPPFGGALGIGTPNTVDSHPGPCLGPWCLDGRPMDGGSYDGVAYMLGSSSTPFVNVSGQLWKIAGGAVNLKPKTLTTMAYVGGSPLVDISGPGANITSDATGSYQYCLAFRAGECRPGSVANDVYVNAPYVSYGYCFYPGIAVQGDDINSICIGPLGAYTGSAVQFGTQQDATGSHIRRLGPTFSRWNQQSVFWNMSMLPSGTTALSQVRWLDGIRHENLVTVLPPYPASDSISRNTFVPIEVKIPPQGVAGGNIVVEFGYGENGSAGSFFCTSRQEACVAASSAVDQASPFYFAHSENYNGVPCASGCTVTIPALSQRILYYRWKQRDASGAVVTTSETRVMVTP